MKAKNHLLISVFILTLYFHNAQAQQPFQVKSYAVTIQGTSSLHDWESSVEKLECKGSFTITGSVLSDIRNVVVNIPVTSIKSPKGKMMDNKTYDAFNYEKNPSIIFRMTGATIHEGKGTLDATGALTMAGVTRATDLGVSYKVLPDGGLRLTGSKKVVMTDFKMEPPTAMMGAIKVGDEVTVSFDMTLNVNNSLTKTN